MIWGGLPPAAISLFSLFFHAIISERNPLLAESLGHHWFSY
jgi:hypothetical protein